MTIWQSIILGIIQGLTEFLPVSSSGHLELANYFFGIEEPNNLAFTAAVHGATVLSTITVFGKELLRLIKGFFKFRLNDETIFILNIFISMIPILFVGLMFKDTIENVFYGGNIVVVGSMLLVTALLLTFTHFAKPRCRAITPKSAFIIGIAQAIAVIPGISRSGATISTGLLQGIKREEVSKFSFLMVLIPIIGMNVLEIFHGHQYDSIATSSVIAGFIAAYITGTIACKWMISLINKGKLIWFAAYCCAMGIFAIATGLINA